MEDQKETNHMCEKCDKCSGRSCHRNYGGGHSGSLVWFLGVIGGAIYYIQQADTFGAGVLGFLKALVWPAMLVYKALGYLGM